MLVNNEQQRREFNLSHSALEKLELITKNYLMWFYDTISYSRLRKRIAWALYVFESSKKKNKQRDCKILAVLDDRAHQLGLLPLSWSVRNPVRKQVGALMDQDERHSVWIERATPVEQFADKGVAQVVLQCLLPMDEKTRDRCKSFKHMRVLIIESLETLVARVVDGVHYQRDLLRRRTRGKAIQAHNERVRMAR